MNKYYHIFVRTKEDENKSTDKITTYMVDITDKSLIINEIIIPYIKKEEILIRGAFLKADEIKQIFVVSSDITSSQYISKREWERQQLRNVVSLISIRKQDIIFSSEYSDDITRGIMNEAKQIINNSPIKEINQDKLILDKSKVFIVHGHDEAVKLEVADFIKTLGLEPIILHQQANNGKTIIEKIEEHSDVGFGVVLYTPCDIGSTKDKQEKFQPRARQNVIFEHGFLIGKIGRENVCALVSSNEIELPNDISGIVYTHMSGNWKIELAKELRESEYYTPKIDTLAEL